MFGFSCLALSKHRHVFNQPDFIRGGVIAHIGKVMHSLRDWLVRLYPKMANKNFILVQKDVSEDKGE
ncbi:Uncharacterised protein [Enterobacter cloacae]|nr:Uncharacterised protein [Enterobacter cloacae]